MSITFLIYDCDWFVLPFNFEQVNLSKSLEVWTDPSWPRSGLLVLDDEWMEGGINKAEANKAKVPHQDATLHEHTRVIFCSTTLDLST